VIDRAVHASNGQFECAANLLFRNASKKGGLIFHEVIVLIVCVVAQRGASPARLSSGDYHLPFVLILGKIGNRLNELLSILEVAMCSLTAVAGSRSAPQMSVKHLFLHVGFLFLIDLRLPQFMCLFLPLQTQESEEQELAEDGTCEDEINVTRPM
jgi:hypothetical protein